MQNLCFYYCIHSFWYFCHGTLELSSSLTFGEGNGNPLQCSCLGNPRDGGAWWAAVYGVVQSDMTEVT